MDERQKKPIEDAFFADRVEQLREEAARLPPGPERNDLLHQARQAEISLRLIEWIASPDLKPPPDDLNSNSKTPAAPENELALLRRPANEECVRGEQGAG